MKTATVQNIINPKLTFSKYDFVKKYVATDKGRKSKQEKEEEASVIADAIKRSQKDLLDNLVTKGELKSQMQLIRKDLNILKSEMTVRMTFIMVSILTLFTGIEKLLD